MEKERKQIKQLYFVKLYCIMLSYVIVNLVIENPIDWKVLYNRGEVRECHNRLRELREHLVQIKKSGI